MGNGFIAVALVLTGLMLYMYCKLLQLDPGKYQSYTQLYLRMASVVCRHSRFCWLAANGKGSPCLITDRRVPELIPVHGSQPVGDVSHKPGGRLPLLSATPAVTLATLKRAATNFAAWWTEAPWVWTVCLRLLPDSVVTWTPGPSAPESSTLTTRLLSHVTGSKNPDWFYLSGTSSPGLL